MKRFLSTAGLCLFSLIFGFFALQPSSRAEDNVLLNLLNLPAPPPPNPLVVNDFKNRTENFYRKNNPPDDGAPIEDLMDYWRHQNQYDAKYTYAPKPSEKSLDRILAEIEKDPEQLPVFLNVLPGKTAATIEFVKRLYDREVAAREFGRDWREAVKSWLTYHSGHFSEDLLKGARQASDTGEYVSNQNELLALARVDWEKARPILERLLNDPNRPISQTLARWAFYERALREGNSSDIEKYRGELQKTVENRGGKPGDRDLAMDALVESGDFEGRDEWYFSLLEDETLLELRVGGQVYTGLTTLLNHSPSDKYVAKMLELVQSDNKTVRSAAARNLVTLLAQKNPEVVRALLPWLEDAKWAREVGAERRIIVDALQNFQMPESVPGLIAVLNEKAAREEIPPPGGTNSGAGAYNSNVIVETAAAAARGEHFPYRYSALSALAAQKDARAIPALRALLAQANEYERRLVVKALLASGGFSVAEQVEALEVAARNAGRLEEEMRTASNTMSGTAAGNAMNGFANADSEIVSETVSDSNRMSAEYDNEPRLALWSATDLNSILGFQLIENNDPTDELVAALLDRINLLETKEPAAAASLRKIVRNWNGAAVNAMLLRDLKNNKADAGVVIKLLSLRRQLREKQLNEIYDVRGAENPVAAGVAACLLEDNAVYDSILAGAKAETKTAMLACARLIRAVLPVQKVAENLRHSNKLLALAAERYLESEDSPEARRTILALHPNEAKILGARTYFAVENSAPPAGDAFLQALFASVADWPSAYQNLLYDFSQDLAASEKKLQKEVRENQELLGVYSYDGNFIRIFPDKAVFSWQEDEARYRERVLTKSEFEVFKNYLEARRVDELPPFLAFCDERCEAKELLMLGRSGGRRVFMRGNKPPEFFDGLEKIFAELRRPPAKLQYWLSKNVPGLEILFADENLRARAVWKNGDDFRLLTDDRTRRKQIDDELERQNEIDEPQLDASGDAEDYEKTQARIEGRRRARQYENFNWHQFAPAAGLTAFAAQPPAVEFIPARDNQATGAATPRQWKARAANLEIRADDKGLYKIVGGRATKMLSGFYDKPVVTPNGRWAIVTKYGEEGPPALVRVNLSNGREDKIRLARYPSFEAVAFVPALNKTLIFGGSYGYEEHESASSEDEEFSESETGAANRQGDYFLLDAATGIAEPVKGEIRPLAQQTFRALQPVAASAAAGKTGEFWAAIPSSDGARSETQFGIYNAGTLAFKPLLKIPQIKFSSMEMWVDAGKIYFVYQGHLLALPLPK